MNKELLYRFFEGKTSVSEEKQIKEWLDASEDNRHIFFLERKMYDAILLTTHDSTQKKNRSALLSPWTSGAAAALLLIILGGLYLLGQNRAAESYNRLIVPPGQRINLILSDNSNVWLNSNTEFRYPTVFSKKERTVYLNGEAYFEVSKNVEKPFIVRTGQGDIRVTGTSFNVEAYSQFNTFETSLFEGGVEIYRNETRIAALQPNQKAILSNNKLVVSAIEDTDHFLWKDGLIAFNNKPLHEILLSLEKYFDTKIELELKSLPQHTYTGKFRQSDGIDHALRVLQRSIHFRYDRDDETGIIYIRR
ncbi:FecR family protein [Petrimonas mucosa]|uniref:Putative anti-sigma factor n=1 Tax=Petrimonas mucosa TaxID=1642646 RepID=A0A1G4G5D1_9BACT|nr:FecR family protein [Petrimonas mucosa]SCM56513.1 putative anti-sigma factor {ECO:0000313/EMBL:GAE17074,1} [Petrimonas mucosa]SFU57019.1 FecR family protein [Porphyromonadaceae bacterium KHP3R9]HHT30418.1 FecR family protein [Petrimonas mucosa]